MQFTAQQYYRVSLQRMTQARKIYQDHDGTAYALAMYCGGLAVESLLRAFRWTKDASFEGRHDLVDLFKASRLLEYNEDFTREKGASEESIHESNQKLKVAMNVVVVLWHNNLRYASEESLKAFLKSLGRLKGVKGDPLKKNALDLIEAAQHIIMRGEVLWTSEIRL